MQPNSKTMTVESVTNKAEIDKIKQAKEQFAKQMKGEKPELDAEEQSMVKEVMVRVRERKKELKSMSKNTLIKAIVHYELQIEQIQLMQNLRKESQNEVNQPTNTNVNNEQPVSNGEKPKED